jgi:deoxyribodipyrimidine photolyase
MIAPDALPFSTNQTPDIFTQFRQNIEKHKIKYTNPVEKPVSLPSLPLASSSLKQSEHFKGVSSNIVRLGDPVLRSAHAGFAALAAVQTKLGRW